MDTVTEIWVMAENLCLLNEKIEKIKTNLYKLGIRYRSKEKLLERLNSAKLIYDEYVTFAETINKQLKDYRESELKRISSLCENIELTYFQITEFCKKVETETNKVTMEKFDIKTAVSLLPIMNGDEDITKKLINSIELYSSMIDKDGQGILINFILKTRLTENAKLRLSASYSDCGLLVEDMKTHLLTKKSSNAVHAELMNIRQNTSSLENYGKKIEELFVDLTISQADGDQNAYAILKPINEKLAIKRFTDGLRDRNLSTIISARNYGLLKDAIRAAKDEELSSSRSASTEDTVYYSGRGRSGQFYNNRFTGQNFNRGREDQAVSNESAATSNYRGYNNFRGRQYNNNTSRGWAPRGRGGYRMNNNRGYQSRYFQPRPNVHMLDSNHDTSQDSQVSQQNQPEIPSNSDDFFRA